MKIFTNKLLDVMSKDKINVVYFSNCALHINGTIAVNYRQRGFIHCLFPKIP